MFFLSQVLEKLSTAIACMSARSGWEKATSTSLEISAACLWADYLFLTLSVTNLSWACRLDIPNRDPPCLHKYFDARSPWHLLTVSLSYDLLPQQPWIVSDVATRLFRHKNWTALGPTLFISIVCIRTSRAPIDCCWCWMLLRLPGTLAEHLVTSLADCIRFQYIIRDSPGVIHIAVWVRHWRSPLVAELVSCWSPHAGIPVFCYSWHPLMN